MTVRGTAQPLRRHKGWSQRKCLCCEKLFASEWVGNRICVRCKHKQSALTQPGVFQEKPSNAPR